MAKRETVHVLSIEDNPGDALLIRENLVQAERIGWDLPHFEITWVDRLAEGLKRLEEASEGEGDAFDVVLTDLDLPDSRAGETFATLRRCFPRLPIVVLTGREDVELARTTLRAGAQDYLYKDEATGSLLAHAMMYAIERQEIHGQLEQRVAARTAELRRANEDLRAEIAERERVEEHIKHLNRVLRAIRNVNQLIVQEKDRARLIQGACDSLVETRGYHTAWITLCDATGRPARGGGSAGAGSAVASLDQPTPPLREHLAREGLPPCGQRGLAQRGVVVTGDPASTCEDCPLAPDYAQRAAMTVRLEHGARVYGLLTVSLPAHLTTDEQEQSLLREVAGDLAFALHDMEVEAQRRRAEEALRESEERFREIYVESPIGIEIYDAGGALMDLNEACLEIFGAPDASAVRGFRLFEDPNLPEEARDRLRRGETVQYETAFDFERVRRRDLYETSRSGTIYLDVKITALGAERSPHGYLVQIQEITARQRAQETLRRSEEKFRTFVDQSLDGVLIVDEQGVIVEWNPALERIVGVPRAEALGRFAWDVQYEAMTAHKKDAQMRAHLKATLQRFLETGQAPWLYTPQENRVQHSDGSIRVVEQIAFPIPTDRGFRMGTVFRDVTGRVRAERALQESERRFRRFVEQSAAGFVLTDTQGATIEWNHAAETITGIPRAEALGMPIWRILYHMAPLEKQTTELTHHLRHTVAAFFRSGQAPWANTWIERRLRLPDGSERVVASIIFGIEMEEGFATGGIIRDITRRKRAEEQLAHYATELERSNRELVQFGSVISHDLQEPLRMVSRYLALLKHRYAGRLDEDADTFIDYAVDGAARMEAMIKALLDLSRVETRGQPFAPTDLEAVLGQTLRDLEQAVAESGVELTHAPLPTVVADETQLRQVLQNLIANAIKFRREGVTPRVHVSAERMDGAWVVSVADNGIGLDPEQADRLFQIFQRLHTEAEYPGLGIGLALCRRIVERHGGRMWVESTPGQGATFSFTLPA
jgi:PAS domain S-box-containing protein